MVARKTGLNINKAKGQLVATRARRAATRRKGATSLTKLDRPANAPPVPTSKPVDPDMHMNPDLSRQGGPASTKGRVYDAKKGGLTVAKRRGPAKTTTRPARRSK